MQGIQQVDLEPLVGWSRFPAQAEGEPLASFVSGEPNGDRLRVRYFCRDVDQVLVGKVWFGPGAVGPPGYAHGGSMAAVLDEAMGAAAWFAGRRALAARLSVDFRRLLPLGTVALLEARVDEAKGRKLRVVAQLADGQGAVFCVAEGLFIEMDGERHAEVLAKVTVPNGPLSGGVA